MSKKICLTGSPNTPFSELANKVLDNLREKEIDDNAIIAVVDFKTNGYNLNTVSHSQDNNGQLYYNMNVHFIRNDMEDKLLICKELLSNSDKIVVTYYSDEFEWINKYFGMLSEFDVEYDKLFRVNTAGLFPAQL